MKTIVNMSTKALVSAGLIVRIEISHHRNAGFKIQANAHIDHCQTFKVSILSSSSSEYAQLIRQN